MRNMATVFGGTQVTIKDIAKATGYSVSTVHRALLGKEGVSGNVASRIREEAQKMGYVVNAAATSLKRKEINIAVVLPNPEVYGKSYFGYLIQGWRSSYQEQFLGMKLNVREYLFDCDVTNDEEKQIEMLKSIYDTWGGSLDGLLTCPMGDDVELSMMIERFSLTGTSVILVDSDLPESRRKSCVSVQGDLIGMLAGEIICNYVHQSAGTIVATQGNNRSLVHRMQMQGFSDYVSSHRPDLRVVWIPYVSEMDTFANNFRQVIHDYPDIVAAYSVRAQAGIPMCNAIIESGKVDDICIVASDLFPGTAELMEKKVIDAIIYKNPFEQGYRGFELMVNSILRSGQAVEKLEHIPISVILHSNLPCYKKYL